MTTPMDELVLDFVNQLDARQREDFEERAAILEFDAMYCKGHAECMALLDLVRRHPGAFTGITAVQVDLSGATHWILTTDRNATRQHLTEIGGTEIGVNDLVAVIAERFGGFAWLSTAP